MAERDWRGPGGTPTLLAMLDNWIKDQSRIPMSLDPNLPPANASPCFSLEQVALTLLGMSIQVQLQEEIRTKVKIRTQTRDNKFRFLMAAIM